MELFLCGHDYKYAVEQTMLMLFPEERPLYPEAPTGAFGAEVRLSRGSQWDTCSCTIKRDGVSYRGSARARLSDYTDDIVADRLRQRIVKLSFYRAGIKCLGRKPVWGALSGIRPAKLLSNLLDEGLGDSAACRRFMELYDVSPERTALCLDTAHATREAVNPEILDVCLYLGVPFCPTRCAYCSFVSQAVEKSMKLIPPFVDALMQDIAATADAVRRSNMRVISIYFGGGTPTTLSARQLEKVCEAMEREFDLSSCREFTVEAGRPDTIDPEKMAVLKAHGVTRVSVNPQTMDDHVLETIGRKHTAKQVEDALAIVRRVGGMDVNMDLIAGLPEDSPEGFRETLEKVIALGPENITIHTLSLKKGSRITLEGTRIPDENEVAQMLDFANDRLRREGYAPYYLYRQKFMSGGFENVGWCKKGSENIYNICIMEELCSIVAMGAGGSTKLTVGDGKLSRFFSPKYPKEYIETIDKICADKEKILDFAVAAGIK